MKSNERLMSKKSFYLGLVIGIVLLMLFTGAHVQSSGMNEISGYRDGVITGVVRDAVTNDPITDALMTLRYHDEVRTEHTDSEGRYIFRDVPLCFCLKNLSAEKSGYESQYKLVAVYKITYVDFSLEPVNGSDPYAGTLMGFVIDAKTEEPIPEALMTLKYHEVVRTTLTDSNGYYIFTNIPLCFCLKNISASKNGYESQYKLIPVDEMTYANFSLEPASNVNSENDGNTVPVGRHIKSGQGASEVLPLMLLGLASASVILLAYVIRRRAHNNK